MSPLAARIGSGVPFMAVGIGLFLAGGVLAALLAARLLPAADYTVYAAYSSLIGMLVLGPAGSFEQESALRASRAHESTAALLREMSLRGAVVFALVAVLVLAPLGWQHRLLDSSQGLAVTAILLGCPLVFGVAIGRGYLTAHGSLRPVGAANATTGVSTLLLPILLHLAGVDWLAAFLTGAILAWLPGFVVVYARMPAAAARPPVREAVDGHLSHRVTAWLLAGNLLMLTALLAVPIVLRWHVDGLGADRVAGVQLLVSISRLSTTVVLGFLALMVARLSGTGAAPGMARRWYAAATGLGIVTVLVLLVIGNPLVTWLQGTTSHLPVGSVLLSTLPAATLCPAVVAMAMAIAQQRWTLVVVAWAAALAVLAVSAGTDPGGDLTVLLTTIAVGCTVPVVVLVGGLRWRVRPGRDVDAHA